MIRTRAAEIDIGGLTVKINIVDNADDLYMEAINDEAAPVWLDIWPAAIALSRYLWKKVPLENSRILELGAGLGLPGVVAAMKGGSVLQTDYIQEAVDIAADSARLNGLTNIENTTANWLDFTITEQFDYIIGSDFLYLPETHPYLKNIFRASLKPGGRIFISDPGRYDSKVLLKEMQSEGWEIDEEILTVHKEGYDYNIYIFQLSRNA